MAGNNFVSNLKVGLYKQSAGCTSDLLHLIFFHFPIPMSKGANYSGIDIYPPPGIVYEHFIQVCLRYSSLFP